MKRTKKSIAKFKATMAAKRLNRLPAQLPAVMQRVNEQREQAASVHSIDKLAQLIIAVAKHL